METVECIFCDGQPVETYKEENGYRAVRCVGCGLVFVTPRPTIDDMKSLYEGQETKVDLHRHIAARDTKTAEARWSLAVIRRHLPAGGRLLEIGSAAGYLLWEAKKQGFDVQGIDITRQLVEFSDRVLGVAAVEGTLRDASLPDEHFDVVYHRNVLSHLAWPLDEHRILHRLLKPGGYLVFETGNAAELSASDAGDLELPDHLYHFSERTIAMLLERSGFALIDVSRHTLIDQLPIVRQFAQAVAARTSARAGSSDLRSVAAHLPPSTLLGRVKAACHQFLRYDVGTWLPSTNRRCTLVVVARRLQPG